MCPLKCVYLSSWSLPDPTESDSLLPELFLSLHIPPAPLVHSLPGNILLRLCHRAGGLCWSTENHYATLSISRAIEEGQVTSSLIAQLVNHLPAVQETQVWSPGLIFSRARSPGEGNGNSLQYSCLENPWTKEPGRLQSMGLQRVGHDWPTVGLAELVTWWWLVV